MTLTTTPMTPPSVAPPLWARGLGTVLAVFAHPDDESYLAAGLMAGAVAAGHRVVAVTATRGEAGDPTADPQAYATLRTAEYGAALDALGVRERVVLGYPDGACADVPTGQAIGRLNLLLAAVRPDTIVTFGPDGITGHPDHVAVSAWTTTAWRRGGRRGRLLHAAVTDDAAEEFEAVTARLGVYGPGYPQPVAPERCALDIELRGALLDAKRAALAAHASQTDAIAEAMGEDLYRSWWRREAFVAVAPADPSVPITWAP